MVAAICDSLFLGIRPGFFEPHPVLKVLHIVPSFYPAFVYGGTTRSTYDLCRYTTQAGSDVRVLTTDANGPLDTLNVDTKRDVRDSNGFYIRYCHRIKDVSMSPSLLAALPRMADWADVIHLTAVYSFPTIPALSVARIFRKPIVWSPRGMLQRWSGSTRTTLKSIWEGICRLASPRKLLLHFTSEEEASESIQRFLGFDYIVIPNSIELPETISAKSPTAPLQLLYLGRLDPKKGIENLLRACSILQRQNGLSWHLTIAGDGEPQYHKFLSALTESCDISNRVRLIGNVLGDQKKQVFEQADVVLVPSHTENFGIVVAEALAHAKPVIASKGTPWKKVEDIGCGLWVDNAPESLALSIRRISQMPLQKMGRRGREWIASEFSGPSIARRMIEVYERLTR